MQKPDAQKTGASGFVDIFAVAKSIYGLCPFDIASLRYDINPTRPAGHIECYAHIEHEVYIEKPARDLYR